MQQLPRFPQLAPHIASILGGVMWLCQYSTLHSDYRLNMVGSRFLASLHLNQFRYYQKDNKPVAFINWAWLDEQREQQVRNGHFMLEDNDWKCGDRLWFMEILAPFGSGIAIMDDLRNTVFPPGTEASALIVKPDRSFVIRRFR